MSDKWLVWVSMKHATFGFTVEGGVVTEAAPYVNNRNNSIVGRKGRAVVMSFREKGAEVVVMPYPRKCR